MAIRCEKKIKISGSGRVRALNLTVPLGSGRVGSDDLGYGPGSGFSLKPVQTSKMHLYLLFPVQPYKHQELA